MTKARRGYVCWRCEHPIPAGTEYHTEKHAGHDYSLKANRYEFRAHPSRRDRLGMYSGDCECAECPIDAETT